MKAINKSNEDRCSPFILAYILFLNIFLKIEKYMYSFCWEGEMSATGPLGDFMRKVRENTTDFFWIFDLKSYKY